MSDKPLPSLLRALPVRKLDPPRGLLDFPSGQKRFRLTRYHASDELAGFVEHYWIVDWDLRDHEPYRQESLPHPSIHIAVESNRAEVVGVMEGRFTRALEGKGRVFGIKFRPGGFRPFFHGPVSRLTNRVIPLADVMGDDGRAFGAALTELDPERSVTCAETLLLAQKPTHDDDVARVRSVVQRIAAGPDVQRVDDLAEQLGTPTRALQRLFNHYVGVSPKWVILRYRLHEALEAIAGGQPADWAGFAAKLGYFDQAHFIKHFKAFVGKTPEGYARSLTAGHRFTPR